MTKCVPTSLNKNYTGVDQDSVSTWEITLSILSYETLTPLSSFSRWKADIQPLRAEAEEIALNSQPKIIFD